MMEIIIRQERPDDYRQVEFLTREAFWNHNAPGCDEHFLVHTMRSHQDFIKELALVALVDQQIVGNIMYGKSHVLCDDGSKVDTLIFGPIAVLPSFQRKGIGRRLIEESRSMAKALGYQAILIYGDPDFYTRVGFVPAETYGIATEDNMYAGALLACELTKGALANCPGRFMEGELYQMDGAKAAAFDQTFPPKALKNNLPSQQRFLVTVKMRRPRP